jgi:hypothetical protein
MLFTDDFWYTHFQQQLLKVVLEMPSLKVTLACKAIAFL